MHFQEKEGSEIETQLKRNLMLCGRSFAMLSPINVLNVLLTICCFFFCYSVHFSCVLGDLVFISVAVGCDLLKCLGDRLVDRDRKDGNR